MKRYYVVSKDGAMAVRSANFNQTRDAKGLPRCTKVLVTRDLSKKRGFIKRDRAHVAAQKAADYTGEEFKVIPNNEAAMAEKYGYKTSILMK